MRLGTGELLIILVVVMFVFGANKIPQFGDALGRGIRNFKKASRDEPEEQPAAPAREALPASSALQPAIATVAEAEIAGAPRS